MPPYAPEKDAAVANFLTLLAKDIANRPSRIRPVTTATFAEAERLTAGIEVDVDDELLEDDGYSAHHLSLKK